MESTWDCLEASSLWHIVVASGSPEYFQAHTAVMENALSALCHIFAPSSHFKRNMCLHGSCDAVPKGFMHKGLMLENTVLHLHNGWSRMESRVFKLGSWMSALCATQPTMLHSSGTFCLTWAGRLRLRRLAHWWCSFCFRYSVRAPGLWQYGWYVVARVWEISQAYKVDSGGLQVLRN